MRQMRNAPSGLSHRSSEHPFPPLSVRGIGSFLRPSLLKFFVSMTWKYHDNYTSIELEILSFIFFLFLKLSLLGISTN